MAEAGSNSEDMKALYFTHFNAIEAQKAIVKEAQAELKALRKKAKGDGCVMADLDYMARCANLDDPEIVPSELLRRTQIAAWFVLPVNYQPDMFEDRAPIDDRAFKEGEKHAMTNGDPVSPYGENSKAGQRWMEGWHEGQAKMRKAMQEDMEARNAAKAGAIPEMEEA
jgi:hypothetical protein